jgi:hypothetical protein
MHWRLHHPRSQHQSLAAFHAVMGEDNLAKATAFVTRKHPKL